MKKLIIISALLMSASAAQAASDAAAWTYDGKEGPEYWGELSESFATCSTGKHQSPVNIETKHQIEADLPKLEINYQPAGKEVLHNGHTIQVNFEAGNTLVSNGQEYELKQVHFHTPSENHIDGKSHAMEAHLVHADKDGNLAVLAVMMDEGETANPGLEQFWSQLPTEANKTVALTDKLDIAKLLPTEHDYYRFSGSLTTPPCSEGVTWLVLKQSMPVSKAQVEQFTQLIGHENNRPIQDVNSRVILK